MSGASKKAIIAIMILVLFGGFGTYLRSHQTLPDIEPDFSKISYDDFGYFGTEHRFEEFAYEVLQADTSTLRLYQDEEGKSYWLFIAYFKSQKYGSQIHSPKHCLPGGGFRIETHERYDLPLNDGKTIAINRLQISNPQRKELMFYWFETRSGVISGEYGLKFDLMRNAVFLYPTDAAICRINIPMSLNDDFDIAAQKTVEFIQAYYPSMRDALPFAD